MNNNTPEDTSGEECGHILDSPLSVTEIVPSPPPKKEGTQCRPDQSAPYKTAIEYAAFLVALLVAWIYWGQLDTMQGQLSEMQKASRQARRDNLATINAQKEIAQTSLATSQENFVKTQNAAAEQLRLDQRAWVGIDSWLLQTFEIGKVVQLKVRLMNRGKTPAINVFAGGRAGIVIGNDISPQQVEEKLATELKKINFRAMAPISPSNGQELTADTNSAPLDSGKFHAVQSGDSTWYETGKIKYRDVFNRAQWMTFCFQVKFVGGNPVAYYCVSGNDMSH